MADLISREELNNYISYIDSTDLPENECLKVILVEDIPSIPSAFEGMTNGEVIKVIFNPYKICEYEYTVHIYMTEEDFWKAEYWMNCDTSWWNSPYQKGGE